MKNPYVQLTHILFTEPQDSPYHLIALSILMHSSHPEKITTNLLAAKCCVSKPTITRFCRSLGYQDFKEFKWNLNISPNNSMKMYPVIHDLDSFTKNYFQSIKNTLNWMENNLPQAELIQLARDIVNHQKIYLFGNAQANDSACNFMRKLLLQNQPSYVISNPSLQATTIQCMEPDALAIILSVNGDFWTTFVDPACFANKPEQQVVYWLTCSSSHNGIPGIDHIIQCSDHSGFTGGNLSIDIALNLVLQYCWHLRN